jgi:hypothetical protein
VGKQLCIFSLSVTLGIAFWAHSLSYTELCDVLVVFISGALVRAPLECIVNHVAVM